VSRSRGHELSKLRWRALFDCRRHQFRRRVSAQLIVAPALAESRSLPTKSRATTCSVLRRRCTSPAVGVLTRLVRLDEPVRLTASGPSQCNDFFMDALKLRHFEAAHPGLALSVRPAGAQQVAALRAVLLARLRLPVDTDGLSLVRAIQSRSLPLPLLDAATPGFDLGRVLVDQLDGGDLDQDVLLNWHRFEQLDLIRGTELASCFADVWYPSVDDLDVVALDARWVLSIGHHGGVGLLRT
jgi:hypothetical protein